MALIATQKLTKTGGLTPVAASAGGDTLNPDNHTAVQAFKANAGDTTITIAAVTDPLITKEAGSLAVPDIVITVPTDDQIMFSIPASHVANGVATMTYDSETDLTLNVFKVEQ